MKNSEDIQKIQDISGSQKVTLYHGSKSGIQGAIAPISRNRCDFGKGFYMGTERIQPLTLICNYPKAKIYTVSLDLSGLKILDLEVGIDWALFVAFHRGKMEPVKGSKIYRRFENMANEICRKYRREGRFFDEILQEGEQHD